MATGPSGHDLRVLAGDLAVARLEPDAPLPEWAVPAPDGAGPGIHAVVRTAAELSVALGLAGVGITALIPRTATLEELFFSMTEGPSANGRAKAVVS